jgi:hypothetical protein
MENFYDSLKTGMSNGGHKQDTSEKVGHQLGTDRFASLN